MSRIVLLMLGVAVLAVVLAVGFATIREPALTESDEIFCLSEQQRSRLVEAIVILGPSGTADRVDVDDLDKWRSANEEQFRRACRALIRSGQPGQTSPFQTTLLSLVGVVIGGAITYVSTDARDRRQRRTDDARKLSASIAVFMSEAENYVRARGAANPLTAALDLNAVRLRRNELVAELRMAEARHRCQVGGPLAVLRGTLVDELDIGWTRAAAAERREALLARLGTLAAELDAIAAGLERGRSVR